MSANMQGGWGRGAPVSEVAQTPGCADVARGERAGPGGACAAPPSGSGSRGGPQDPHPCPLPWAGAKAGMGRCDRDALVSWELGKPQVPGAARAGQGPGALNPGDAGSPSVSPLSCSSSWQAQRRLADTSSSRLARREPRRAFQLPRHHPVTPAPRQPSLPQPIVQVQPSWFEAAQAKGRGKFCAPSS